MLFANMSIKTAFSVTPAKVLDWLLVIGILEKISLPLTNILVTNTPIHKKLWIPAFAGMTKQ